MGAFLWAALAFLLLVLVAGGVFVALRALTLRRLLRTVLEEGAPALERLVVAAERLAERGEWTAARVQRLIEADDRLERSLARARLVAGAPGEVRGLLALAKALVPQR